MLGSEQVIEGFRLSPQQKRVWQLQHDSRAFSAQSAMLIEGEIETQILERALTKMMQRHEILRTTLDWFPGLATPVQIILDRPPLPYRIVDLSDRRPEDLDCAVDGLIKEESRPFDLKRGLLVRFCLAKLQASRSALVVTLHSLCADSRTLRNLFKEISRHYASELKGQEVSDEPVQYLQYSEWQNEMLEAQDRSRAGEPPALELTLPLESHGDGTAKLSHRQFAPEVITSTLDSRIAERIEGVSRTYNSSISGFLLACWQILLWRLTGEEEITIDCILDGRPFEDLHTALGLFAGPAPVRGVLGPDLRFGEALKRAIKSLEQAEASQELFLLEMTKDGAADRAGAIGFEYEERPAAEQAGAIRFSYWRQAVCIDRCKLKLGAARTAGGLLIDLLYDPAVFSPRSMELMRERLLSVLESALDNEGGLIGTFEIVGPRERQQLLIDWNRTHRTLTEPRPLHQLIAEQAAARPEAIAVCDEQRQLSYGELERRANRLAHRLRALGVGPESVVGLHFRRSVEMIVGLLGILKAGAAYLPLEVGQPEERLRVMIADAGVKVLVGREETGLSLAAGIEQVMLDRDEQL
ncbi:MAG TPA: condensation domain-containing protein, partial [Blastocatellia bacterium]|nr:condensation domain-containing protein [Blastocatellia bacterium]